LTSSNGSGLPLRAGGGVAAGLGATLLMEQASSLIYQRQSEALRDEEEQLRKEMPTTVLVRKAAGLLGRELDDETAQRLGMATHYAFGASGGPVAQVLRALGASPLKAGLIVATGMEIFVDQTANTVLGLTAPSWKFPAGTHVRAVAAHVVYGTALGLMLAAGDSK
jgi:hypothetical protein